MVQYKIIDNFLNNYNCQLLIDKAEYIGFQQADISFTPEQGGPKLNLNYRNNERVNLKDPMLRDYLFKELQTLNLIPDYYQDYKFSELSDEFRFYKYTPGHFFKKHRDQNIETPNGTSFVTLLIYLNTAQEGGYTNLIDNSLPEKQYVQPIEGRLLMFDHKIMHEGEELKAGVKYVLRTDFLFKK